MCVRARAQLHLLIIRDDIVAFCAAAASRIRSLISHGNVSALEKYNFSYRVARYTMILINARGFIKVAGHP